jgi:hypothetical protein
VSAARATALDVAAARRLTRRLQDALTLALDLLQQAHDGHAWRVLGYESWPAYCAAELPQLAQLRLPLDERRAAVATLRGRGMSLRAIGAPLGLAPNTVRADLDAAGVQLATVTSLDGRQRPAAAPASAPRPRVAKTDRAVALVAAAGPDGLTVRDLVKATRWNQCQASATLHRLAAAGRLTYRRPERRGQLGSYVR